MDRWSLWLRAALLAALGWWIYAPVLHGSWIWDDLLYLPGNPLLNDPERLWKLWFAPGHVLDYYPIEATVQWAQWQLWGNATFGYHVTNVVLHILNALLVWRLLEKFHLRLAWLGGLLFLVQPVQVESVAYISELKNTLSLTPFLFAMIAWIDYEDRRHPRDYALALGLFLVAMLCKISMAPFPVVILLYAWWKRGRINAQDFKHSAPFFLIALALGTMTILSGIWYRQLHLEPEEIVPLGGLGSRLACAGLTFSFYFAKCFWPGQMLPIYPHWQVDPPSPLQFVPWLVWGALACWLWSRRQGWGRHALLGLGFFALMIAPFLGFNGASYMSFTWVMDHFLYIAIIGLIGLVVAALEQVTAVALRLTLITAVALVAAWWAVASHTYAGIFRSNQTLWSYTIQHHPQAWAAHNNLGMSDQQAGQWADARAQYEAALQLHPDYADALNNLGSILASTGHAPEAVAPFEHALSLNPNDASVHYNLGSTLLQLGRTAEAIHHYEEAIRLHPSLAEAHYSLGNIHIQAGQFPEAIAEYQAAVAIAPGYADAHANLGNALLQSGQTDDAITHYQLALKIHPADVDVRNTLGLVFAQLGRLAEAREQFETILRIDPKNADALHNLAQVEAAEKAARSRP